MTVHIFGAVSSPSISNFVLKATADVYGLPVADTIRNNFYVDDCLKSVSTEDTAVKLVDNLRSACEEGGFQLTKFTSNNRNVLNSIPSEHHSKHIQTHDLNYDLLIERALGMQWHINTDMFGFTVDLKEKPFTRRGLLSTMSSLYDPLGIVAPVMLPAKKVLQDLCTNKQLGWDDEIPAEHKLIWKEWLRELQCLNVLRLERCLKPALFGNVVSKQLHVFSDVSTMGYGCVAYLRLCDDKDNIHTAFLMGKSRLAPVKTVTIPRLELTAATVAVHIGQLQLDTKPDSVTYYTDSTTVLHYINSERKRLPVFVANRVKLIRDFSEPDQWKYIDSKTNPADVASRGVTPSQLIGCNDWFKGPQFLMKPESEWSLQQPAVLKDCTYEEVVTATETLSKKSQDTMCQLMDHYSSWYRLKRAVVIYHRLLDILHSRKLQTNKSSGGRFNQPFTVQELDRAENVILKFIQLQHFDKEMDSSSKRGRVPKSSSVYRLDPFLDNGLLKVGGRLSRAEIPEEMKYPVLLPYKSVVTSLIITDIHLRLGHAGRNHVLSALREKYWVIKANSAVRTILSRCVTCRKLRTPACEQKMADLPSIRVKPTPPFTYTGVDFFGPHVIKEGRKYAKRYGHCLHVL
ncbi:uncharacterized protein LOC124276394 [Haliotis rubra]|uniref:uncharacterized protein LOC124276394 n=1 Tax=Haliotis rubra TaxID=36100 RepID=UPI001EE570EE|nr:uncharacterized protein LOC124276394 [Haliotis rubra]